MATAAALAVIAGPSDAWAACSESPNNQWNCSGTIGASQTWKVDSNQTLPWFGKLSGNSPAADVNSGLEILNHVDQSGRFLIEDGATVENNDISNSGVKNGVQYKNNAATPDSTVIFDILGDITSATDKALVINGGAIVEVNVGETGSLISSDSGLGVEIDGDLTVTNEGNISNTSKSVAVNARSSGGDITVTNSGVIEGGDAGGLRVVAGGDAYVFNSGTVTAVSGKGMDVTAGGAAVVTNRGYSTPVSGGLSGALIHDVNDTFIDNAGGLFVGGTQAGIRVEGVAGEGFDEDNSVSIVNRGYYAEGPVGGGVIISEQGRGIDLDTISNGDIEINNEGYWDETREDDADPDADATFRSGGLIVGGLDGIRADLVADDFFLRNDNTRSPFGGIESDDLPEDFESFDGYTTGIIGMQNGVSLSNFGTLEDSDSDSYAEIDNSNGLIVGLGLIGEGDGIRGRTIVGSEAAPEYFLLAPTAFVLHNNNDGLVWGGHDGVDLADVYGLALIDNGGFDDPDATGGTIFGGDNGIRNKDTVGSFIYNREGLIEGRGGDGISLVRNSLALIVNGTPFSDNALIMLGLIRTIDDGGGRIIGAGSAIATEDTGATVIRSGGGGLIVGDGAADEAVIEVTHASDREAGDARVTFIMSNGVMASHALPHFDNDWEPATSLDIEGPSFDWEAFEEDIDGFADHVENGGQLDDEALAGYKDAADDMLLLSQSGENFILSDGFMAGRMTVGSDGFGDKREIFNYGIWFVTDDGQNAAVDFVGDSTNRIENKVWIQTALAGGAETATFNGLDEFYNIGGVLSLADGEAGDTVRIGGDSTFRGTSAEEVENGILSHIAVDVDFGVGEADFLDIGAVTGTTAMIIRNVGGSGASGGVIELAEASGAVEFDCAGTCLDGDAFFISSASDGYFEDKNGVGLLADGLLAWRLVQGPGDIDGPDSVQAFNLEAMPGTVAINAPTLVTGAQNIAHGALATVADHNAELTVPGGGGADSPVADATAGIWTRMTGSWAERDDEVSLDGIEFDTDFKQDIFDIVAGADLKADGDSAFRLGLFGGYVTSSLDMDLDGSSVDYEGGTVGAVVGYDDGIRYADLVVAGHMLDADYSFTGSEVGADILNVALAANAGYRFDIGAGFIEPLASVAYVHSEVDDLDANGGTIAFSNGDSLRAGIGARVGATIPMEAGAAELSLLGKAWNEFEDANEVTVTSGGTTTRYAADIDGAFGEVQAVARMTGRDGRLSSFLLAGGQFGAGFTQWNARAGLDKNF